MEIGDAPLTAAAARVLARERGPFSAVAALMEGGVGGRWYIR